MYLELYQYVEGDDIAQVGDYLGFVRLEEDDIVIDVNDDELAEEMGQLFSEPITVNVGIVNDEEEIEPYTSDFFRHVRGILPDYGIRGILTEDDEPDKTRRTIHNEEEDDEDETSDELGEMGMMVIDDFSDDYNMGGAESEGYLEGEEEETEEEDEEEEEEDYNR